jgi:uncharacterized protein (DUF1697 family)
VSSTAETAVHGRIVLLLRGINVGGHHSVPMAALRLLFADELHCTEFQTYIQSGNVVCTASPAGLTPSVVSQAIEQRFGFAVPVVVRTAQEWNALIAANPLVSAGSGAEFLHLLLLTEPIPVEALHLLQAKLAGEEQLEARGRELYLSLPHGAGRSKLALACSAPKMPRDATMRNWRTVLHLQSML